MTRLNRRRWLSSMRPGVAGDHVDSLLRSVGLVATPDLLALYDWRNGSSSEGGESIGDLYMFPGFYALSIDDATANYEAFVPDERWARGWLPVLADGGGDFYVVDLGPSSDGEVRRFRIEESHHPVEFASLADLLTTIAEAFDREVIYVDPHENLEMDDLRFASLAAELNPGVGWWEN